MKINIQPALLRISGISEIVNMCADYSMRIWLNPEVMAQYKLIPSDIEKVLGEQNLEAATGSLGENSKNVHQYTMKYKGRLEKPEEFGNMVIRSLPNGEVLRLKDVATIELGAQNYVINGQIDGHPAATCMIFQTAGSNANEVVGEINDYLETIEKELPKGVKIAHLMSTKDFLDASIHEIIKTLNPAMARKANVPTRETMIATDEISVERRFCKKTYVMSTTNMIASISVLMISWILASKKSFVLIRWAILTSVINRPIWPL